MIDFVGTQDIDFKSILAKWPILHYALFFASNIKFDKNGQYWVGRCPWAPRLKMTIDTQSNTWHVEGLPDGDVLDWHMHTIGADRSTSALNLAAYDVEVWG